MVSQRREYGASIWPALLIVAVWLWVFWPLLTGQSVAGFRDSAYLYYPLFKWIDMEWAAGAIPLWNPYDGAGQSLLADGSSSIFYPGKLVFGLSFLSYPTRYGWYLSLHVLLAAVTSFGLAKTLGCNRLGRTVAAVSYAFGGSVLFQVSNVIYLVGAAWLPLALTCVWMMYRSGRWIWPLLGGAVCSLMILGGDPQMVYHVGLIAAASLIGGWVYRLKQPGQDKKSLDMPWLLAKASRLLILILVTTALAAIQLVPSYERVQSSQRASDSALPVTIYQALSHDLSGGSQLSATEQAAEGLLGTPTPGTHEDHIYQFSQPPWSVVELLWPNVSGRPFPVNQRWVGGLPGADLMWVPSIYLGVIPLLLAICSFRLWGGSRQNVWLSRVALWFVLASFGWYGMVWLGEELSLSTIGQSRVNGALAEPNEWTLGPQVGGLYWFMVIALPKYFWFRYPAKLFVIAGLAICILAGRTLSNKLPGRQFTGLGLGVMWLSMLGGAALLWWIEEVPNYRDPVFGPLQLGRLQSSILFSLVHSVVVLLVGLPIVRRIAKSPIPLPSAGFALVGLLVVDLLIANTWMLAFVPVESFESPVGKRYSIGHPWDDRSIPLRVKTSDYQNANPYSGSRFASTSSTSRLEENVVWQREVLFPKHHLPLRIINRQSFSSIAHATPPFGLLDLLSLCRNEFGESMEIELASNSLTLEVKVPADVSAKSLPMPKDPDWKVRVVNLEDEGWRAEEGLGAYEGTDCELTSGSWRIHYFYWPSSFVYGAAISAVAWCGWSLCVLLGFVSGRGQRCYRPKQSIR